MFDYNDLVLNSEEDIEALKPEPFETPLNVVTFIYKLKTDEFISTKPHAYQTQKGFMVIPGYTSSGIKKQCLNQFMFCNKSMIAYMLAEKEEETKWRAFFLHRVLRVKKKAMNMLCKKESLNESKEKPRDQKTLT